MLEDALLAFAETVGVGLQAEPPLAQGGGESAMIDRKTFWISRCAFVGMPCWRRAAWRVSLLADWTHLPRYGEGGVALSPASSVWLLVSPGVVVLSMILLTMQAGMADASDEALRPWKKWSGSYLVAISAIMTLLQAFIIAGSLGLLAPMAPVLFLRGMFIVSGLLLAVMSNGLPEHPGSPSVSRSAAIEPDQGAKSLRVRGWLGCPVRAGRDRHRAAAARHDAARRRSRGACRRGGVGALPLRRHKHNQTQ